MNNSPLDTLKQGTANENGETKKVVKATELKPADIEQEKKEFLERVKRFKEKEKFYNEEKIRLNNLLKTLREELELPEQENLPEKIETPANTEPLTQTKEETILTEAGPDKEKLNTIEEKVNEINTLIQKQNEVRPTQKNTSEEININEKIIPDPIKKEIHGKEKSENVLLSTIAQKIKSGLSYLWNDLSEKFPKETTWHKVKFLFNKKIETIITEDGEEIKTTVLEEPLQIKIEEVIAENISPEEIIELQEEFPDQNIKEVIENKVVEQINDKTIVPVEKRKKDNLIDRSARKVKISLLAIFVSTSIFESSAPFFKTADKNKVFSYNNLKVDNLKDWEKVKLYEDEVNKLENISIITKAHENSNDKYIIIDKLNGKAHRYQGDNLIKSYNVALGKDSIGDDQTTLKSIYRKASENPNANEGGEIAFHRRQEVSLDEATYIENGERYMREGYEAFTKWGEGNMQTGAGTYTISNKGPFLENKGIFLKNERGAQVATSMHFNSHVYPEMSSHYISNGCVGCDQPTIDELYKIMSVGENVYILPANPQNKYQIIDGELRFLSNQQNVNRTIRSYKPEPIVLKAEDVNEIGKELLIRISENKEKLMSLYPTISNSVYDEFATIAYGIFGQESTFGTYGKARGQYGRARDIALSTVGYNPSVGPCQVSIENISPKVKNVFNIKTTTDLLNIKTNAAAAMSVLLDNYLYAIYNGKGDQYKEISILKYNAPKETAKIIKGQQTFDKLGPITSGYLKKVLKNSKLVTVYRNDKSYYNQDWNYVEPNEIAMNNPNN